MDLLHPDTLSTLKAFRQIKKINRSTSRSSNPNWYKDALGLDIQWHIFVGSDSGAISFIRNVKDGSWAKGPNITTEMQERPELLQQTLAGIQKEYLAKDKKPALGIILYVADEFATAELGPEHQNPAEIHELRRLIKQDPSSILEDQSISNTSHSWRLFPYPGAVGGTAFATAISLSRKHDALLTYCRKYGRENDFPILTRALSAPLCTISALPWMLEKTPENGFVTILHYPRFSVLAFFNIHGDLILIRTLQHHGNAPFAPNTATAIMTTATSLELANPHVFILPMAGFAPMGLSGSISSIMPESEVITLSPTSSQLHIPTAPSAASKSELLGVTRPWKWSDLTAETKVESVPTQAASTESDALIPGVTRPWKVQDMAATAMLQQVRLEIVSTTNPPSASNSALAESHTFSTLVQEMWPIQDFLPPTPTEADPFPDQVEMKVLKIGKLVTWAGLAGVAATAALSAIDIIKARKDPAWGYTQAFANHEISKYKAKIDTHTTLDNILADRSRAWTNIELLSRLFPNPDEVKLISFEYSATPADATDKNAKTTPLARTWRISGIAKSSVGNYLRDLNTKQGISKVFTEVSQITEEQSFDPTAHSRTPIPNISTSRAASHTNNGFDLTFKITIEQRIVNSDPLSIISK